MHSPRATRFICQQCRLKLQQPLLNAERGIKYPYRTFKPTFGRYYSTNGAVRPFRLAVIGSGPAGFYTAYRVMQKIPGARVDMYERLPVPFGLVRYGVAPDHPEVKVWNCQDKFEEIASSDRFEFIGNIAVGTDIPLPQLVHHYDALLFAYGAAEDRKLGIPGEELNGVYSARAFVGWYNGLPEHADLNPILDTGDNAVVIGQGNVALDVARILLMDVDELRKTDIAEHAIETLSKSRIKGVSVVGRRGPMQAAFTIKELRELMKLPSVSFDPIPEALLPSNDQLSALPRQQKRIAQLLAKGSTNSAVSATKSWSLGFLFSPKSFNVSESNASALGSISFTQNQYKADVDPMSRTAGVQTSPDAPIVESATALAFRSVGYRSTPLPTLSDIGVPFDTQRGIIPNDVYGRVLADPEELGPVAAPQPVAKHVPGVYCAGWVKRGPTGVIASTMEDAFATGDAIAADFKAKAPFLNSSTGEDSGDGWEGLKAELKMKGLRRVSWEDWKKIDKVESDRGERVGKEREKFESVSEMLKVLGE
ncbi:NADPH:adrenodoxin oxidoreductase [Rhizodiscina lignyota]|uniref:NADPH:adrenodoxin oxidoreductase, mitochondrial n=1 Tax=Rhizodiscina lignyota TaxID=1504668 RepID=A0A9P4ILC3_9PEZI|nr:NADPH:adrenodoxin oxidoreductase [Rhizodiscina lignyota]